MEDPGVIAALEATRLQEEIETIRNELTESKERLKWCQSRRDVAETEIERLRKDVEYQRQDAGEEFELRRKAEDEVKRLRAVLRMTDLADLADQLTEED
jgi:predicted  nucleic acid-binding Zn-ribbon protein